MYIEANKSNAVIAASTLIIIIIFSICAKNNGMKESYIIISIIPTFLTGLSILLLQNVYLIRNKKEVDNIENTKEEVKKPFIWNENDVHDEG